MSEPEHGGSEPITAEGLVALQAEIAELEGPPVARDGGADQGGTRARGPEGERRLPPGQGRPGPPRDPDQAPSSAVARCGRDRGGARGRDASPSPSAARPRSSSQATGKVHTWTLVGSTEADLASGRLSAESPIGSALKDRAVGEAVQVLTPGGERTFRVQVLVG